MISPNTRLNEDVLHLIFGHLDDLKRGKSLVNAAMTCKDFYQPALQIIWRNLDDLFPLFKLFSTFMVVRVVTEGKREHELYMIDGAIPPQEWERFRMHAEFVQTMGHPWNPLPFFPSHSLSKPPKSRRIAASALSYLGRLGAPLLPNLRRLRWAIASTQCTALYPLISPSIKALTIVPPDQILFGTGITDDERREWQAFIRSTLFLIVSVATHITELYLNWDEEHSIAEPVAQLQSLRCFKTARADGNLLRVLAALPSLEKLTLGSIVVSEKDTFTQADAGFLHLQRFSMQKHPNNTRFYRLFDSPGLRYLDASFFKADDYRDILGCCTAWARRFPLLENVKLFVTLDGSAAHHPRPYSSIIEPLFQLRSLRYVDLKASCEQFVPNDADIEAVAHNWSELIHFCATDLNDYDSPQSRTEQESQTGPCIGPSALVLLASRCPLLLLLQIPRVKINLANIDALSNFPVLNHRLHTLFVGSMHSDDCSLTALFVDRLFPHLQNLGTTWSESTWGRVKHHVKVCQTARRQQAQRTASSVPVTTDV
ncbi:hypothetical protein LXA43DRAFT_608598 [Ganoderma leucocontextum]|nr:hypothetical protein LXA43DRAFT_608598 [Ganoderma leucocontextum]